MPSLSILIYRLLGALLLFSIHTGLYVTGLPADHHKAEGPAFVHPHLHDPDIISVTTAGTRRDMLASFGTGPLMSQIQDSIKHDIRSTTHDMEQQVAKLVAKQVGDQVVRDMNNITSGALDAMGFSDPAELGQYIGSWAGWLVTVMTSATNTAVGGGGTVVDAAAADAEGTDATFPAVGYGGGSGATGAETNDVTEADLLRLKQVLEQLHALERGQQQEQLTTTAALAVATGPSTGRGGGGAVNRTAVEEAVAQLVWRAVSPVNSSTSESSSGGNSGDAVVPASFKAIATDGSPVGPIRGLTGASEVNPATDITAADLPDTDGGSNTAALAAAALRTALVKNDTATASLAVATLLDSLRSSRNMAAGAESDLIVGGGDVANGAIASTVSLPTGTARLEVLPLPARASTGTQSGTSRPPRHGPGGPNDGPNVKVGRDLNVNVNVNVVPASATMPNGGGADGCACTCPARGGIGGLAGALAGNLLDGFLPGKMRLATGSGGGGDGGLSMQQSAPQQSDGNTPGIGVRTAAAAIE
ncbi:hypothetical protein Vafri_15268, partial [Volvox africanus]